MVYAYASATAASRPGAADVPALEVVNVVVNVRRRRRGHTAWRPVPRSRPTRRPHVLRMAWWGPVFAEEVGAGRWLGTAAAGLAPPGAASAGVTIIGVRGNSTRLIIVPTIELHPRA